MSEFAGKHILIIVENLPVPFDRRVWLEANTLKSNGAEVSVICPKMRNFTTSYEVINGIHVYRHPLLVEAKSPIGYLFEYSSAIFWEFILAWKVFFRKKFHVIHACNPPDLIFITALPFKLLGVKFLFDQHDANPEFYESKFEKKGFFLR